MKPTAILFTVILVVTGMAFIGNADGHSSPQFAYKQDTVPTTAKMQMKKEVESDSIGAEYPGDGPAWSRFLSKNLKCPVDTSGEAIRGTVVVEFIIDEEGNVTDVKATSGSEPLVSEAVRVIKKSSKWIPGKLQSTGRLIKSPKRQPLHFGQVE
jgi:periplasmic protein TonB